MPERINRTQTRTRHRRNPPKPLRIIVAKNDQTTNEDILSVTDRMFILEKNLPVELLHGIAALAVSFGCSNGHQKEGHRLMNETHSAISLQAAVVLGYLLALEDTKGTPQ